MQSIYYRMRFFEQKIVAYTATIRAKVVVMLQSTCERTSNSFRTTTKPARHTTSAYGSWSGPKSSMEVEDREGQAETGTLQIP